MTCIGKNVQILIKYNKKLLTVDRIYAKNVFLAFGHNFYTSLFFLIQCKFQSPHTISVTKSINFSRNRDIHLAVIPYQIDKL